MNAHSIIRSIRFISQNISSYSCHPHQLAIIYILSKGECLATLPGSSKKFPTRFVTLPSHNGAREPSLKPCPFKSQTPFNGVPSIHSRSDAFVPQFLSRYVNAHVCVRQSLLYRFFFDPTLSASHPSAGFSSRSIRSSEKTLLFLELYIV